MDIKLTLSLDQGVIEAAKEYAKRQNTSLSNLVEQLLKSVALEKDRNSPVISPLVQSLSGVISADTPADRKSGYSDFLAEKYK